MACDDGVIHTFAVGNLKTDYDSGMNLDQAFGDVNSYCLSKTVGGKIAKVVGPGNTVVQNAGGCLHNRQRLNDPNDEQNLSGEWRDQLRYSLRSSPGLLPQEARPHQKPSRAPRETGNEREV